MTFRFFAECDWRCRSPPLVQRRPLAALVLHALLVLGALAWAVREFGFDWWQPALRGVVIIIIAFRLLTPGVGDPRRRERSA